MSYVYKAMREYVDGRDALDSSNIYKTMFELATEVEDCSLNDKPYDVATEVEPTLTLSLPVATHTRGGTQTEAQTSGTLTTSWAVDKTGDVVEFLYASKSAVTSPEAASYYLLQSDFDAATGDIELDLCHTVSYIAGTETTSAGDIYAPRLWLKGNSVTHAFQLKGLVYGGNTGNSTEHLFSYAASGVAQGEGEYMIFHTVESPSVDCYYKIPADATEADLEGIAATYPSGMSLAEVTAVDANGYLADEPAHDGRRGDSSELVRERQRTDSASLRSDCGSADAAQGRAALS